MIAEWFCTSCKAPVDAKANFCTSCGTSFPADIPKQTPKGINCKVCDSGTLEKETVYKFSSPVVTIGYIVLVPSLIAVMFCLGTAGLSMSDNAVGAAVISFFFAILCFVPGLLGWLLIMKKKVLRCNFCGANTSAS